MLLEFFFSREQRFVAPKWYKMQLEIFLAVGIMERVVEAPVEFVKFLVVFQKKIKTVFFLLLYLV